MPALNDTAVAPPRLPLLPLLGFGGMSGAADGTDWARLRALQFGSSPDAVRIQALTQCVAALATLWLFQPLVDGRLLAGWLVALLGSFVLGAGWEWSQNRPGRRPSKHWETMLGLVSTTLVNALVWGATVMLLAREAPMPVRLELWTVLALLMTSTAVVVPTVPLTTMLFSTVVGGAMIGAFVHFGMDGMAVVASLFVTLVMGGALESARNYLRSRMAEAEMAERNALVSLLLGEFEEGDADWLWRTDPQRRVCSVSRRFANALGLSPEEAEGRGLLSLIAGEGGGEVEASIRELAERLKRLEAFSNLAVCVSVRGERRWWELSGTPRSDANGVFEGWRGVGSDVTEARESSARIAWLARFDTLTGLPNRLQLTDGLSEALGRERNADPSSAHCALLMLDLDRFKTVNDTLGHLVGDQLLAQVSQRLQPLMGPGELCGRLGGDEFAVVLSDLTEGTRVATLAKAIIDRLSQPYLVEAHTLHVGASVGSAVGPRDGASVKDLMRNADLALYRAKADGGGCHRAFEAGLHALAQERRKLEEAMRGALERDEFRVTYQPVVDAEGEFVVGFEALTVWDSPQFGLVNPARFIPIAQDTRLIVPIGEKVLREACAQACRWPSHIRLSINVAGEQLVHSAFLDRLVGTLAATGLAPQRLEIEVTEAVFRHDAAAARAALERIVALGCGIALDDFGTGRSSLNNIRELKLGAIKVDGAFVQGAAAGNRESLAILRAVAAMAESLEIGLTAEGVETEEQLRLVRGLGCRRVQGFYFGRPMMADDAAALLSPDRRVAEAG